MASGREHATAAPDGQRAEANLHDEQEEQSKRRAAKRRNLAMSPDDTRDRPQNHRGDDDRTASMREIDRSGQRGERRERDSRLSVIDMRRRFPSRIRKNGYRNHQAEERLRRCGMRD